MTPPNADLADRLAEIAALLRTRRGERFRTRAYERAARTLRSVPVDATAPSEAELRRIDGIGSAIAGLVGEYAATGELRLLTELRGEEPTGFPALLHLPLVGARDARLLASDLDGLLAFIERKRR